MDQNDGEGFGCPKCGCKHAPVKETRSLFRNGIHLKIRIRQCRHCGKQFRTKEITDQTLRMPQRPKKQDPPPNLLEIEQEETKPDEPSGPGENPFMGQIP